MTSNATQPASSDGTRGLRFHLLPLVALLCVAIAPFVEAIVRGQVPFFLDLQDHWHPFRLHAHRALAVGELPHWWSGVFSGVPFLAQPESSLFYPPHWVSDRFDPSITLLPQLVLHRFVLGALFYAAARLRGATRMGSFLAGFLGILCGVTTHAQAQLAHLRTLAWLPLLVIGATFVATNRPRRGVLAIAAGVALPILAGYPAFLQRSILVLPLLLTIDSALRRDARPWAEFGRRTGLAAGGVALGVALAAIQVLPSMAMASASQRALGLDASLLDDLHASGSDLATILLPRLDRDGGVARAGFAYLGAVPPALAALAVLRRCPGAIALAVTAALGVLAALGTQTPVGMLLHSMPGGATFKNPAQYLLLWMLAMPLLAAHGLDAWRARRPTAREFLLTTGVVVALFGAARATLGPAGDPASQLRGFVAIGAIGAVGLARFIPRPAAATWLLALVTLVDVGSLGFRYTSRRDGVTGRPRGVLAERIRAPQEPFATIAAVHAARSTADGPPQPARIITSNAEFNWDNRCVVAGLENVRGLTSLALMRTLDLSRVIEEGGPFPRVPPRVPLYDYGPVKSVDSPLIDLLALRYAAGWTDSPGPGWRRIGDQAWERDAVDPLRFVVRAVPESAIGEGWRHLLQPGFDPVRTAVIAQSSDAAGPSFRSDEPMPGKVVSAEFGVNGVTADVDLTLARSDCGVLLWSESYDEGWTATIDGDAAEVRPANHAFMAIRVPHGKHRVVFQYRAPGFDFGLRVSIAALVIAGVLLLDSRRRP